MIETKKYVDFLINSAESLTKKIKTIISDDYDELEVIYFVGFVMCDLLRAIDLQDEKHWKIVNKFIKQHAFTEIILKGPNGIHPIQYLNEKSVIRSDRMNEFKNSFPLIEGIVKEDDKKIQNLANRASSYICINKNEVQIFSEDLFPILKEHSLKFIDDLRELAGWKKVTGIFDIIIAQEKNIQEKIRNKIKDDFAISGSNDIPNETELYYYVFYLIHSYYQKVVGNISENFLSEYSTKSLDKLVSSTQSNIDRDEILSKRKERYTDYKSMWLAIEHAEDGNTNNLSYFFQSASKYIYGKNVHGTTLILLQPEILDILSIGTQSIDNAAIDFINKLNIYNEQEDYSNNIEISTTYYENGEKKKERTYKDGILDGKSTLILLRIFS